MRSSDPGIVLDEHYEDDGDIVFNQACKLGSGGSCQSGLFSVYRSDRTPHWAKIKNPKARSVTREAAEGWR